MDLLITTPTDIMDTANAVAVLLKKQFFQHQHNNADTQSVAFLKFRPAKNKQLPKPVRPTLLLFRTVHS
ncbi:hypothetical protein BVY02_02490 [bacterium J17]|nr:hypothetical protein BVY02_02490 [bacterium J17]